MAKVLRKASPVRMQKRALTIAAAQQTLPSKSTSGCAQFKSFFVNAFQSEHEWISIFARNPCSTVTSFDRVWILYTSLLMAAAMAALFVEGEDIEEVELEFTAIKNWILTAVYSALTAATFVTVAGWAFQPSLTRFFPLVLSAAEAVYPLPLSPSSLTVTWSAGRVRPRRGVHPARLVSRC